MIFQPMKLSFWSRLKTASLAGSAIALAMTLSACGSPSEDAPANGGVIQSTPSAAEKALLEKDLGSVPSTRFNDLAAAVKNLSVDDSETTTLKGVTTASFDGAGDYDPEGRFNFVASTIVPIVCYNDTEENVSLRINFEKGGIETLVNLVNGLDCDSESSQTMPLILFSDLDGKRINATLPKDLPADLMELYKNVAKNLSGSV